MELFRHGEPERIGSDRLDEPLGHGGMGPVWRAWDDRLKRQVAIKQARDDAEVSHPSERLRREARAMSSITIHSTPSASPMSNTCTIAGWLRRATRSDLEPWT